MTDVSIEWVSTAIGAIYDAAYDQEQWPKVLSLLCEMLGGSRACIVHFDPDKLDCVSTVANDREFSSPEVVAVHMRDPLAAASAAVRVGEVYRRSEIRGGNFFRSELWQDWFRPRDMYDGLACNLLCANGSYWMFDIHRGPHQATFGAEDVALLQAIVPHLVRAGEIGRHFHESTELASIFSNLPFGIILVDAQCRATQMNEAAEAVLARVDSPLCINAGHIGAVHLRDGLELQRLVRDACCGQAGGTRGVGGAMTLPSSREHAGPTRLVLSVAPFFDARAYGLYSETCAALMIRDVTLGISDSFVEHISAFFSLTRAEAGLAASLASGNSLRTAATDAGVTYKTGRTYLERIFHKTGARQQSSLVALLKSMQPIVDNLR